MSVRERFAGPNGDIPRPDPVDLPPSLDHEMPIRIAVLAEGAITPMGNSAEETWEAYKAMRGGIVEHLYKPYTEGGNEKGVDAQIRAITAGTIKDFDPFERVEKKGILPRKEVRFKLGTYTQYSLASSHEALSKVRTGEGVSLLVPRLNKDGSVNKERQWRVNPELIHPLHFAVAVGCGFGGGDVSAEVMELLKAGQIPAGDHMMKSLLDRAASTVTQAYDVNGGAEGYVAACASSGAAEIGLVNKIAMGRVLAGLAIGTEGILGTPIASAMFDAFGALDRGQDPLKVSRSLHKERRGFTIAEGAIAFVLANYDWAKQNKIPILYEIIGYGDTSGAGHNTDPNGVAQEQAMRFARRMAEKQGPIRGKIINSGHYTGTPAGDGSEMLHTQNVLEEEKERTIIFASKGSAGHTLGAAGNMSQFTAGKALQEGVVPGMRFDGEVMDEAYGWDIPRETREEPELTDALVNQFGFGDKNVSIWLRKNAS